MTLLAQIVTSALLLTGSLLALFAAIGLHRFPDVFCRMHAATKPGTLGAMLVCVAAAMTVTAHGAWVKLLLVVVLQFLTNPVGAHMVGRAAYRSGIPMTEATVIDEFGRPPGLDAYAPPR